jgi:rod shape-determining protein MreC
MYRKQVRRRRAVLVVLVVASLALISTHFSEGESGPLHSVQNGVGAVLGPIEDGANRALKPLRDLVNWFDETFEARGENDELREQVRELSDRLAEAEGALEENEKLRKITKMTGQSDLQSFEPISASVRGRSPSTWNQTLIIDAGEGDGVQVDDAVVTGEGLVGRISSLAGGTARVTLLTHPESAVTGRRLPGGPTGVIAAKVGDPESLVFELISSDKRLRRGDKIVTAGITDEQLSSRFPAGIPIGEVDEVRAGEQELRQQVNVRPFAEMSDITVVSVLTGGGS